MKKLFLLINFLIALFFTLNHLNCYAETPASAPKVVNSPSTAEKPKSNSTPSTVNTNANTSTEASSGNEGAHGGSDLALEFKLKAFEAIDYIKNSNLKFKGILNDYDLEEILNSSILYVVDEPLYIPLDQNGSQLSVAISFPSINVIYLNRSMWNDIQDPILKQALALHEILVLARIEKTGIYTYSQEYLYYVSKCKNLNDCENL